VELFETDVLIGLVVLGELLELRFGRTRIIAIMPKSEWKMKCQWYTKSPTTAPRKSM
jgi:hypothetical protein